MADTGKIPTPPAQWWQDFRRGPLTVIVWAVALLVSVWMLAHRATSFEVVGLARALEYEVSAGTTGQVEAILIDELDTVEPGQPLAQLDQSLIAARIATAQTELDRIRAELRSQTSRGAVGAVRGRLYSTVPLSPSNWTV